MKQRQLMNMLQDLFGNARGVQIKQRRIQQRIRIQRMRRIRQGGNILALSAVLAFIILLVVLWALDLFWLHILSGKEMSAAEKVAMAAAVALNKDDSIGQMNYMLAHSRELICCLRYDESVAEDSHKNLHQLAKDLSQKAHDSASNLAKTQMQLQALRMKEAVSAAEAAVASAGSPGAAQMTGVATSAAKIDFEQSFFGCEKKDPQAGDSPDNISCSNVEPSKYCFDKSINTLLDNYDKKFIDQNSHFYKGNLASPLDLNFPGGGDDQDLQILLVSLPPCTNNYIVPPKIIQASAFHKMSSFKSGGSTQYIPTAVQITLKLDVKNTQSQSSNQLTAPGIAVTSGSTPSPMSKN